MQGSLRMRGIVYSKLQNVALRDYIPSSGTKTMNFTCKLPPTLFSASLESAICGFRKVNYVMTGLMGTAIIYLIYISRYCRGRNLFLLMPWPNLT